jgi:histidinol-phosphate/aromatic aminotransferase/cobyric acid decarboxylase-like protein
LQLSNEFEALGLSYIPSSANFIAVKVDKPNMVYQALLKKGFIVEREYPTRKAAKPYALEKVRVITKLSNACSQPIVISLTSKYSTMNHIIVIVQASLYLSKIE